MINTLSRPLFSKAAVRILLLSLSLSLLLLGADDTSNEFSPVARYQARVGGGDVFDRVHGVGNNNYKKKKKNSHGRVTTPVAHDVSGKKE